MALLLAAASALPPGPVDFSAAKMRIDSKERRVFLDGNVKLVRGDLTVTGDHAVAFYAARAKQVGGQSIDRFTVDGNVHIQRGTRTAEGAQADVNLVDQTTVLTGTPQAPPVVRDGSDVLSGDRIVLHLDTDDTDVQRPRLLVHRSLEEEKERKIPMRVEAATLLVKKAQQVAHFTGNVVVHRDAMVVKSPRMDALYDKDGQLTRLELRGGVDLTEGDRRATGQSADFDAKTHVVVLTGEPRLYDRGDVLNGERIEMALDTREVRAERVRGRVRPEIHNDEMEAHR